MKRKFGDSIYIKRFYTEPRFLPKVARIEQSELPDEAFFDKNWIDTLLRAASKRFTKIKPRDMKESLRKHVRYLHSKTKAPEVTLFDKPKNGGK